MLIVRAEGDMQCRSLTAQYADFHLVALLFGVGVTQCNNGANSLHFLLSDSAVPLIEVESLSPRVKSGLACYLLGAIECGRIDSVSLASLGLQKPCAFWSVVLCLSLEQGHFELFC